MFDTVLGIQTPTHVFETYRDPEYRWNEWDMRKEALKKSNAKNNKTTYVQTEGEPSAQLKMPVGVQASVPNVGFQLSFKFQWCQHLIYFFRMQVFKLERM